MAALSFSMGMRFVEPQHGLRYLCLAISIAIVSCCVTGCAGHLANSSNISSAISEKSRLPTQGPISQAPTDVHFTDITRAAGINFRHWDGGYGKKFFAEPMSGGCAFLDYNNDGWLDILLLNGAPLKGCPTSAKPFNPYPALYHNNRNGTFTDVTAQVGLKQQMYALGVAVGDYDNDGYDDIYITCLKGNHLFHNRGPGQAGSQFVDVTRQAGVADNQFATSCGWLDYDNDGWLDLYVCNYVKWDEAHDQPCIIGGKRVYCTPVNYRAVPNCLYHNNHNGTFTEVAQHFGAANADGKSLGVTMLDYDGDGWMDIFVANDGTPNALLHNEGGKRFQDVALEAGVAFPESGTPKSGMGVDAADFDHSGRPSLITGNFHREGLTLHQNTGQGNFDDVSAQAGVNAVSLNVLTFGLFLFDYDLDGFKDVFAANGHILDNIHDFYSNVTYAERPLLLFNRGNSTFQDVSHQTGLTTPLVARGASYGDFDNDGDLDILVNELNGHAHLYRNDGGNQRHWLKVQAIGSISNRDAIGTKVEVETAAGKQVDWVRSGSSYCSSSDRRLCFGLGHETTVKRLTVTFPSRRIQTFTNIAANQWVEIHEAKGLQVHKTP